MKILFFSVAASLLLADGHTVTGDHIELSRSVNKDLTLPKAISDHTAVLADDDGLIYIAGGCDDPNGNT